MLTMLLRLLVLFVPKRLNLQGRLKRPGPGLGFGRSAGS